MTVAQPTDALACAGAPGVPKPGSEGIINFGSAAVQGILDDLTEGTSAIAFATIFGGATYNGTEFCSAGDVGDPGMSAQDWSDALDVTNPVVNAPARTKAQRWFQHVIFPIICNCANGTAPPPATPPGPPPVTTSPNTQPYTTGPNCWDHSATSPPIPNGWDTEYMQVFPNIPTTVQKTPPPLGIQQPLPAGYTVTITAGSEGSNPLPVSGNLNVFNSGGGLVGADSASWSNVSPGTSFTTPFVALTSTAAAWNMALFNTPGGGALSTNTATVELTIYCQGQSPTGVNSPCCPPDPSVDLRLGQLLDMVTQLLSLQALQGAYQDTITHPALSGNGTITINPASSAIRIDITTDLTSWPQYTQTPTYFLSLGFITPYAVGTPLRGQRVIYNHQTFTWPSYTDQVGYSLAPGITANIVELTRGA